MPSLGTAFIDVRGDFSPFNRQMGRFSVTSRSQFAKVGKVAGLGFVAGLAGATAGTKKSIDFAVDLGEQINKTRVVFRGSEKDILRWSKTTASAIGTSRREALEAAGTFGNMLVPMGIGRDRAGEMSTRFVRLAADMASFNNASPQETLDALRAGLAGETEPLRRFGVFLNEARIQQEALKQGIGDGTGELSAQQKALATYSIILKDTKDTQGDFKRTSGSLANQQRILKAQFEDLGASAGKLLLPPLTDAAQATSRFVKQMQTGKGAGGEFAREAKEIGQAILPIAKFAGRSTIAIGKFTAKHPELATMATSAGLIGTAFSKFKIGKGLAGVLALIRGGKSLAGGRGLGGVLASAKPVPVFVTNPGFGPGLPGGKGPKGPVATPTPRPGGGVLRGVGRAVGGAAGIGLALEAANIAQRTGVTATPKEVQRNLDEVRRKHKQTTDTIHDNLEQWARDTGRTGDRTRSVFKSMREAGGELMDRYRQVSQRTDTLTAKTSSLAGTTEKGRGRVDRFGRSLRDSGFNAAGTGKAIDRLIAKVNRIPSKKPLTIEIKAEVAQGLRNLPSFLRPRGLIESLEERRRGGSVGMRGGGLVPSLLSPGEVGILPSGQRFKVPGARVAADTVPMRLPHGTAILTADGQRKERRGVPLPNVLSTQRPHFQQGGLVNATKAAGAMKAAGLRRLERLVTMVATGGRETGGTWDPRAKGGPNQNGTFDHGWLQINDVWRSNPRAARLWNKRYTFDGSARLGKVVLDEQGLSAWRLPGWQGDSTIDAWRQTAERAVKAAASKGGFGPGSRVRVTPPAITHPLLATQLRPLIDDALLGGIEAGRERTGRTSRVDLLQSILEGIVPDSSDRATRERLSGGGGRGGGSAPGGPIGDRIQAGLRWAETWTHKGLPYVYGGGHGLVGVPSGGPPASFDCSGLQSGIAHAMGLLNTPLTTDTFKSFGLPGKGRNVTFGIRGGSGRAGHMMGAIKDKDRWRYFESSGAGVGERSGWSGAFTTWRHPAWRTGGVVGMRRGGFVPPSPEGRRHLEQLAKRRRVPVPELLDPKSKHFVGFGLRTGGAVGPDFDFEEWLRRLRKRGRRPTLDQLTGLLGADQLGTRNADLATRTLARRVEGRSTGALVRQQRRIRQQIRRMARKGFTGPERIRTRRLRGALSLVQDELGRPIGRALGRSDRLQELIDRRAQTLPDRLTVLGVDPESTQGLQVQRQETADALFRLGARRNELQQALKRARRSGNKQAVRQVQAEITEVDDQMLSLRAALVDLDKSVQQVELDRLAEELARQNDLAAERNQLEADRNTQLKRNEQLITAQGPALIAALTQIVNGQIGGTAGLGRAYPSRPGSVARV